MSSLSPNDRVFLCLFSFTDGRRCRTPRTGNHPHFCFYHARKEAQARAAESLAKDLANFFSGDYLCASDLSAAMARLIPAVIRGDIKPRLARTVAYMFQTQLQAIHLSQHEYINAFGTDGWRKAVRSSVNVNYDYRFPSNSDAAVPPAHPVPPQPPAQPAPAAPLGAGLARPDRKTQTTPQPQQPAPPATNPVTQPPPPPPPQPKSTTPTRDPYSVHFDHTHRLLIDSKPW